jgi:putative flavoprotein involved in K+ transport
MQSTDVVIIGAGQAGLAMSACLTTRRIDHVVLERGRVAQRWRAGSWDSLQLLTPSWLSRLPGWSYCGPDPHGYMGKDEFISYLSDYASAFGAPLVTGADVRRVTRSGAHYCVETQRATFASAAVVVATGQCETPFVPAMAQQISASIHQLPAAAYRRPDALPTGGVLVVGASASGLQIAEEIHRSGRRVVLAAGRHARLPRRYRGRDIMWWLDRLGMLDDRPADVPDLGDARRQPSTQLVGRHDRKLDLAVLRDAGVRVVGRACAADATCVQFAGDLAQTTASAERKHTRMLARIDRAIADRGLAAAAAAPCAPVLLDQPATRIDLAAAGIATVIWATGYRPRYRWLAVPVLDPRGDVAHDGGVTAAPGLYVLGLRWLRRRSSSFIDGTGRDAHELAEHVAQFIARRRIKAA